MVTLSEEAVVKIKDLLAEDEDKGLRLFIKPGGCSGFSYGLAIDEMKDTDSVLLQEGIHVLIDPESAPYLNGAEIDFVDSLSGSGFTIHNPNAVSTCGCGSSFRTAEDSGSPGSCD